MKTGIELITIERMEQIGKHGWTLGHDKKHDDGSLIRAAISCAADTVVYEKDRYANAIQFTVVKENKWQLPLKYNGNVLLNNCEASEEERIHQLKVAGALIAAEIDRIQAIEQRQEPGK